MTDDTADLTFEDAMRELESIVRDLETGKAKLDDAINAYERGALLKRHCETKLAQATAKVEQIAVGSDGTISAAPLRSAANWRPTPRPARPQRRARDTAARDA